MTIENGGEQPANDTALVEASGNTQPTAEASDAESGQEQDVGGQQQAEEDEEVDYEGAKYRVPKPLKDALLRQADYTTKTQALAEQRKALEAERETWGKSQEAQRSHFQEAAKIVAFNDRIGEVDKELQRYANIDWAAIQDPTQYQQHRAYYDSLRDRKANLQEQRDTAARAWTEKEREYATNATRQNEERIAKAQAEIAKHLPEWKPGGELDLKLETYAKGLGFPEKEIAEIALRAPQLVKELNRLRLYDEAAAKQKQQQTFQASQQAKPVTRVGGSGASSQLRTNDPSGDRLSAEEWSRREDERMAAKRKAMGLR